MIRVIIIYLLLTLSLFADLRYLVKTTPSHTDFDTVTNKVTSLDSGNLNNGYKKLDLGFDFPFNGTTHSSVYMDTNGRVIFTGESDSSNDHLSDSSTEEGFYPYWDDLVAKSTSDDNITYGRLDTNGVNDRFVISWNNVQHRQFLWNNGSYTFQVVLYRDGKIRFRYTDSDDADGSSATIGVKEDDNHYDEHTYNDSSNLDRTKDILYTPTTISGHIYEDPNGDSQMGDKIAKSDVNISLYDDNGNLLDTNTTDSSGSYKFYAPVNETLYVVVDSKTITPNQTFNSGSDQSDIWAEQTYGGKGAQCADGSGGTTDRTTAGSCFGGRRGDTSDDASSLDSAEHRIKITTSTSTHSYTSRDFGFSFNAVTSIRDGDDDTNNNRSIQGSLRQFIQNANALNGANSMHFVPTVAKNESNWWKITLSSDLDNLADDDTTVNGTAYSLTNGTTTDNSNTGSVSVAVSTVGAGNDGVENTSDEHTLPNYDKKELEIDGGDHQVFDIRGDDSTISNLSIYHSSSPSVYVRSDNDELDKLYLGARADGSEPESTNKVDRAVISTSDSNNLNITQNYIAFVKYTAIRVSGTAEISENVLHSNALSASNSDAITVEGNSAQHSVKIWYNYIDAAGGYGIESWQSGGGWDIQYNTILNTGSVGSSEIGGVRIFGKDSQIKHNIIKNTHGAGVVVVAGSPASNEKNIISKNVIYNNSGLGIDLDQTHTSGNPDGDGVTANNGTLDSGKQNNDMDYPIISQATYDGSTLHIEGFVSSAAGQSDFGGASLEIFESDDDGNNNGEVIAGDSKSIAHGEAKAFIFDCTADSNGNFSCDKSISGLDTSIELTMTATLSAQGTSEFSANYPITLLPIMNITKSSCVIDDPINNSSNPKRIPGATIRYAIEVKNSGIGDANDTIVDDNISSSFDTSTIKNLQIKNGSCNCTSVSSASNNGPNGTSNGVNPVKLDFGTINANSTKCGYFEVQIK